MLACSLYVDLNPVRAGLSERAVEAPFTSAHDRHQDKAAMCATGPAVESHAVSIRETTTATAPMPMPGKEPSPENSAWLTPLELQERLGADTAARSQRRAFGAARASDRGFLPMKPHQYFGLLDWVIAERERRLRESSSAQSFAMPEEYSALLTALDAVPESWTETVWEFGARFRNAVGRTASLTAEAARRGRLWLQGQRGGAPAFR